MKINLSQSLGEAQLYLSGGGGDGEDEGQVAGSSGTPTAALSGLRIWSRSYSQRLESLYRELGLSEGATPAEVKQAYHRRALQCHPDLHSNDGTEFMRVTKAYNQIMNRGANSRLVHVSPSPADARIFQGPVAFWWVSLLLGVVLFWYPSHMYLESRSRVLQHEPSRFVEPSRDAIKRERIAAILFERQRKAKEQD